VFFAALCLNVFGFVVVILLCMFAVFLHVFLTFFGLL